MTTPTIAIVSGIYRCTLCHTAFEDRPEALGHNHVQHQVVPVKHKGLIFDRDVPGDATSPYKCDCGHTTLMTKQFRNHLRFCKTITQRLTEAGRERSVFASPLSEDSGRAWPLSTETPGFKHFPNLDLPEGWPSRVREKRPREGPARITMSSPAASASDETPTAKRQRVKGSAVLTGRSVLDPFSSARSPAQPAIERDESDQDMEDGNEVAENEADGEERVSCGQGTNEAKDTDDEEDLSATEQSSPERDASTRSSRLALLRARREELARKRAQPRHVWPASPSPRPASPSSRPASPSPHWSSSPPPAARAVEVNRFIDAVALCSQDTDMHGDLANYGAYDEYDLYDLFIDDHVSEQSDNGDVDLADGENRPTTPVPVAIREPASKTQPTSSPARQASVEVKTGVEVDEQQRLAQLVLRTEEGKREAARIEYLEVSPEWQIRHPYDQPKMAYNTKYGFLYCRSHGMTLPMSGDLEEIKNLIGNHLRNMHIHGSILDISTGVRDEICRELGDSLPAIDWIARRDYFAAGWDTPAIALELVPCSIAWACRSCSKVGTNHRRMITHVREHGVPTAQPKEITVQTIGSYRHQGDGLYRLVPVQDPVLDQVTSVEANLPALAHIRDLLEDVEMDLVVTGQGARHLSEFHRSIDWADIMETVGLPYLANLGRRDVLPGDPVWMHSVHKWSGDLFMEMYRSLDKYKYHPFRVDLQRDTATNTVRDRFRPLQESVPKYARGMQRLLMVTLRWANETMDPNSAEHGPYSSLAATHRRLVEFASWQADGGQEDDEISLLDHLRLWLEQLFLTRYRVNGEQYDPVFWFLMAVTTQPLDVKKPQSARYASDLADDEALLQESCRIRAGAQDEDEEAGLPGDDEAGIDDEDRLDALRAHSGRMVLPAHMFSGLYAQVQYVCRMTLWNLAVQTLDDNTGSGEVVGLEDLKQCCSESVEGYAYRRIRLALGHALRAIMDLPPRVTWGMHRGTPFLSVNNTVIDRDILSEAIHHVMTRAEHELAEHLCWGMRLKVEMPSLLKDDMRNSVTGYSFITDPANGLDGQGTALLDAVGKNAHLQARLLINGTTWNHTEILKVLRADHQFLGLLFACLHLSCGIPARAAEYNTLRLVNLGDTPRSVYHDPYQLFLLFRYTKTTSTKGQGPPHPRFPSKRVASLLLVYLVKVRPMMIALAKVLTGTQAATNAKFMRTHLFASYTGVYTPQELRSAFATAMHQHGKLPIGISDYRHVCIQIHRKFIGSKLSTDPVVTEFFAKAAHHSMGVDKRHYAGNNLEPANGLGDDLLAASSICTAWHDWIGMSDFMVRKVKRGVDQDGAGEDVVNPAMADSTHFSLALDAMRDKVDKIMHGLTSSRIFVDQQGRIEAAPQAGLQQLYSDRSMCQVLYALRTLLQKQDITFCHPSMMRTIDSVMTRQVDILAIYPTGSGKSMMMWIPAALEEGMTTVLVSLFWQLGTDMIKKGNDLGLRCEWWTAETSVHGAPQVLVIPVESIHSNKFQDLMIGLHKVDRLSRFVLDEAHVLRSQGNFRVQFDGVMRFRAASNLKVPWLMLSATLPPSWEAPLLYEVGSDAGCTLRVRAAADRPNLRYIRVEPPQRHREIEGFPRHNGGWKSWVSEHVSRICDGVLEKGGSEARVIIYCPIKIWVTAFGAAWDMRSSNQVYATAHKISTYLADMTDEEKQAAVNLFVAGITPIVVATSAFGQGIDHSHVRAVILVGEPWNMLDVAQQAGRAGRDGNPADIYLVPSYGEILPKRETETPRANLLDPHAEANVNELFNTAGACLRRKINRYLEEVSVPSCLEGMAGTQLCSACHDATQAAGMRPTLFVGARNRPRPIPAPQRKYRRQDFPPQPAAQHAAERELKQAELKAALSKGPTVNAETPNTDRYRKALPCREGQAVESTGGKVDSLANIKPGQGFSLGSPWKPAPTRASGSPTAGPLMPTYGVPAPIIQHVVQSQQSRFMAPHLSRSVSQLYQEWINDIQELMQLQQLKPCGYCYVDFGIDNCLHLVEHNGCPATVAREGCLKCGETGHVTNECPLRSIQVNRTVSGVKRCYFCFASPFKSPCPIKFFVQGVVFRLSSFTRTGASTQHNAWYRQYRPARRWSSPEELAEWLYDVKSDQPDLLNIMQVVVDMYKLSSETVL